MPFIVISHIMVTQAQIAEKLGISRQLVNPLFPFPDRLRSVFSALDEKANS